MAFSKHRDDPPMRGKGQGKKTPPSAPLTRTDSIVVADLRKQQAALKKNYSGTADERKRLQAIDRILARYGQR